MTKNIGYYKYWNCYNKTNSNNAYERNKQIAQVVVVIVNHGVRVINVGEGALDKQTIRPTDEHWRYAYMILPTRTHFDQVIRFRVVDDNSIEASRLSIVDFQIKGTVSKNGWRPLDQNNPLVGIYPGDVRRFVKSWTTPERVRNYDITSEAVVVYSWAECCAYAIDFCYRCIIFIKLFSLVLVQIIPKNTKNMRLFNLQIEWSLKRCLSANWYL